MEYYRSKRLLDILGATVGILIFSPLMLLVALCIRLESEGPALLKLPRCGKDFSVFMQFKLRSMRNGADEEILQNPDLLRDMVNNNYKLKKDPRITKFGRLIRKFSIDELPQLWNVFLGDMSLVGPRPPLPREVENYDNWQRRKLSMRPGITCLWQAAGRSEITNFKEWMKLDLEYIDNWSLILDMKILIKTIAVVLLGTGR